MEFVIMNNRIRKTVSVLLLFALSISAMACMGACTDNGKMFETDLFRCTYNEDETGVIILGLTEKGKEQEILVIPEEINGLPVVQLGGTTKGYPYQSSSTLRSEKVKKVYFKTTKANITGGYTNFQNSRNVDFIIISPLNDCFELLGLFSVGGYVDGEFVSNNFYGNIDHDALVSESRDVKIKKGNVIFYDSPENAYWLDEIKEGGAYITPESPTKDDFVFDGWYYDLNYQNSWNGKFEFVEGDELLLFAKWSPQA